MNEVKAIRVNAWSLTNEEIWFLRDAANLSESKLLLGNITILAERTVAKAQARKLVEWVEEQMAKELGFDSMQGLIEADAAIIPAYWQTLKKEVGLEVKGGWAFGL